MVHNGTLKALKKKENGWYSDGNTQISLISAQTKV